jgi:hypothetical protein
MQVQELLKRLCLKMFKYTVYLRAGLGDYYSFVAQFNNFCKQNNTNPSEFKFMLDNHYHWQGRTVELKSCIDFLNDSNIQNTMFIPAQCNSVEGFTITTHERSVGADDATYKNVFMFWCRECTKEFVRNHIEGTFIYVPYVAHAYIWDGVSNNRLNYKQEPVNINISEEEKQSIDPYLTEPHILIHYKPFGRSENENFPNRIIQSCIQMGLRPIIMGLRNANLITHENIIDLREKISFRQCMYLTQQAKYTYMSGANFAFHRVAFKHPDRYSFLNWPIYIGDPHYLLPSDQFSHSTHFHYSSDIDEIDTVITKIRELKNIHG